MPGPSRDMHSVQIPETKQGRHPCLVCEHFVGHNQATKESGEQKKKKKKKKKKNTTKQQKKVHGGALQLSDTHSRATGAAGVV